MERKEKSPRNSTAHKYGKGRGKPDLSFPAKAETFWAARNAHVAGGPPPRSRIGRRRPSISVLAGMGLVAHQYRADGKLARKELYANMVGSS